MNINEEFHNEVSTFSFKTNKKISSILERKIDEIQKLIKDLSEEMANGIPVIVEGYNDVKTLNRLGLNGEIICVKTMGKTFLDVIREIERRNLKEVILLMDFDRQGRKMTILLTRNFEVMKVKSNLIFWKKLSYLVGKYVKDIEGLATYFETLEKKLYLNK
jgi:2,5-diamino-6-(ribosylamino)-4(3H)-pyrimidinone 5'-phosphate reductase